MSVTRSWILSVRSPRELWQSMRGGAALREYRPETMSLRNVQSTSWRTSRARKVGVQMRRRRLYNSALHLVEKVNRAGDLRILLTQGLDWNLDVLDGVSGHAADGGGYLRRR